VEVVMAQVPGTADRILAAATEVFAADGFAGARIDRIAELAGCNKQLLYHHFGDKEALYAAVIEAELGRKVVPGAVEGGSVTEQMVRAFFDGGAERRWLRLTLWEALGDCDTPVVAEPRRRELAAQAVELIRGAQEAGVLRADLDARAMILALLALTSHPWMMPPLVRIFSGGSADDPAFQASYTQVLRAMFSALVTAPEAPDVASGGSGGGS
jgi:AcrR family transcriptional regulator